MKILYLSADFGIPVLGDKGASVHIRQMVKAFSNLGHSVQIVTSRMGKPGQNQVSSPILEISPEKINIDTMSNELSSDLDKISYNLTLKSALRAFIKLSKPDFIYERYSLFSYAGVKVATEFNIPHFLEVNSLLRQEQKKFRTLELPKIAIDLEEFVFKNTTCILTVSGILKKRLTADPDIKKKIQVMPNGVDTELFYPRDKKKSLLQKYNINGKFVIGFTGSLKPWHGLDTGIEALRDLVKENDNFLFLIVGEGPLYDQIESMANQYSLPVLLTGAVPHTRIPDYLSLMDLVLAPYQPMKEFYFSPLKVFEYMSMERPVIASKLGQLQEIIQHQENGILCEPGNSKAWKQAILDIYYDKKKRKELGKKARESIISRFTWMNNASRIISLVEKDTHRVY